MQGENFGVGMHSACGGYSTLSRWPSSRGHCKIIADRSVEFVMNVVKIPKTKVIPPAGRKLGFRAALARTNKKFGKTLAKLAK
jgi:hypothetical protein